MDDVSRRMASGAGRDGCDDEHREARADHRNRKASSRILLREAGSRFNANRAFFRLELERQLSQWPASQARHRICECGCEGWEARLTHSGRLICTGNGIDRDLRHVRDVPIASPREHVRVAQLVKEASLSRSAFFERFSRAVGVAPMEYLLAWRMALAMDMLRQTEDGIAKVAERVGYSSASTFTVAFTRYVGMPPARYAREQIESRRR